MSISVVIPLYNKGPYIERALNSVLSQTSSPSEIIVIDDGSTDGGGEVVKTFTDPRILLFRQKNQGESAARNRGAQIAKNNIIAFLDADDAWDPDFLATILRLQRKFPQAGAFATAYRVVCSHGSLRTPDFLVLPQAVKEGLIINYFRHGLSFPVWSSAVAVPKNVLQQIGGFQVGERKGADVDAWLKIALRFPIAFSREHMATYFENASNRTVGFVCWDKEPAVSRTARQAIDAGIVPSEQVQDLKNYVAHFQLSAARDCLVLGNKKVALQLLQYARGTPNFANNWWLYRLVAALPGEAGPWLWRMKQHLKKVIQ
jgi:glycosyltransferase involved in cell wall biosynthesis